MLVSLLVFVTIAVLAIPAALALIPFTLLSGNVVPLYVTGRWIARTAMRVAGIRIQIQGREKIPAGRACIFFANHVSNLDAPALICNLPGRTSVFLKRPLMKLPILGYAFKLANFIPVDRTGSTESAQEAVADAERVLADGLHITTFIEGMRSLDGRMLPFKKGAFYLAKDSGAPCIPVSIFGTEKIIPWGSKRIHPGVARVVFHPALDPADYATRDELSEAVRAAIASGLPEWMRDQEPEACS
ncbi:MAG: lysophospholipid acyltransferase family protein [Terracidiphilus sp.]